MKLNHWIVSAIAIVLASAPARGQNAGAPVVPGNEATHAPVQGAHQLTADELQFIAELQAYFIKDALAQAGYTDQKLVQTVLDFVTTRTAVRMPLRQQSNAFAELVANQQTPKTDVSAKLQALRAAVETESDRSQGAIRTLDAQIGYSKDVRLEAILNTLGIFDNLMTYANTGGTRGGYGGGVDGGAGVGWGGVAMGGPGAAGRNLRELFSNVPGAIAATVGDNGTSAVVGDNFFGSDGSINGKPGPGVGVTVDLGNGISATGNADGGTTVNFAADTLARFRWSTGPNWYQRGAAGISVIAPEGSLTIKGKGNSAAAGSAGGGGPHTIILTPVLIR